jgi:hypothetical protein
MRQPGSRGVAFSSRPSLAFHPFALNLAQRCEATQIDWRDTYDIPTFSLCILCKPVDRLDLTRQG